MNTQAAAGPRRVLLGQVTGVHGIKGEIIVRSHTTDPADIAAHGPLEDEDGRRKFTLTVRRVTDKGVVAKVAGIDDRTTAESLRGLRLYVDRARLPAAMANEFYYADLVGLAALAPDGRRLGEVVAVHNFGAGDIVEVRLDAEQRTEMVPFSAAFVGEVDIAAGRLTLTLPASGTDDEPGPTGSETGI